jgi:hypothetical protein
VTVYDDNLRLVKLLVVQKAIADGRPVVLQLYENKSMADESGLPRARTAPARKPHNVSPVMFLKSSFSPTLPLSHTRSHC